MTSTQYLQLLHIIQTIEKEHNIAATNVSLYERLARDLEQIAGASSVDYNKDPLTRIYKLFYNGSLFIVCKDKEEAA